MTIQKWTLIIFSVLTVFSANQAEAQSIKFLDIYLEPDTIRSGNFKKHEAYDLDHMVLYKKVGKSNLIQIELLD